MIYIIKQENIALFSKIFWGCEKSPHLHRCSVITGGWGRSKIIYIYRPFLYGSSIKEPPSFEDEFQEWMMRAGCNISTINVLFLL
jgi:hypothetical protein